MFCDDSVKEIVDLLFNECNKVDVIIIICCEILSVEKNESGYLFIILNGEYGCEFFVIVIGGLSMFKLGVMLFGYKIV